MPQLYVLITSVVAARFLGPDGMGRQSFIAFVALSTTMVLASGLSIALMRYIGEELGADRPATALDLASWASKFTLGAATLGAGFLTAVAAAGADPTAAWVLAGAGAALGIVHTVPSAMLIGAQRWREATIVGLATGTVAVPATIAVLAAGGGITGMFAVEVVVAAVNLGFTTLLARRAVRGLGGAPQKDPLARRSLARYAAWSSLSVILSMIVFRRSEFFFLDAWSSDSEIAIYSIAFAAVNALVLIFEATAVTLLPAMATLHGAGASERIRAGYRRGVRLLLMVALPTTAGLLVVGPDLLQLVYGSDYSGTAPVLRVMVVVLPFVPLMYVGNALLIGMGYVWPPLIASSIAAVVNVGLAVILIPRYDAVGAALANAVAQVVVALVAAGFSMRVVGASPVDLPLALRTVIAAAASGLAAWAPVLLLPGGGGALVGIIAGVATFLTAGRLLRILPGEDAEWLLAATRGTPVHRAVRPASRFLCPLGRTGT